MKNPIKDILKAGKPALGGWLNLCSPLAAEVMAAGGLHWVAVDSEHSAFDIPLIADTFRGIEARGAAPFVRAWNHDPVALAQILDAGAFGIVIPHVSTPEQARAIVDAMRYPPVGHRSAGTGRIAVYGAGYKAVANEEILVIPQIEDQEGIDNTEAILSVEGVDVGFLGPGDLSLAMGVEQGSPEHEEAVQKFLAGAKAAGKPCGMPSRVPAGLKKRIDEGFQFLDIVSDLRAVEMGVAAAVAAVS